jgi:SNF2-related domain
MCIWICCCCCCFLLNTAPICHLSKLILLLLLPPLNPYTHVQGKTLQTISLICHLKESHAVTGPSLVICPLSVLYSWCSEIAKWAPSLKHLRFHSSSPESMEIPDLSTFDIIVTTVRWLLFVRLLFPCSIREYFLLLLR